MKFNNLMMMAAAAAIIAAPAFAEGSKTKHSKHTKTVSSTLVSDTTTGGAATAPGAGSTYDSTPNVERTLDGMNNQSDSQKVQGVGASPNSKDPSAPKY